MKTSVFFHHVVEGAKQSKRDFCEVLREMRALGLSGLELELPALLNDFQSMQDTLLAAQLGASCVCCWYDLTKPDNAFSFYRDMELVRKVGAKKALIVPGFLEGEFTCADPAFDVIARYLEQIVAAGKESGVQILLEPFDNHKSPCEKCENLEWFVNNVHGLGIAFDTGNSVFADEDPLFVFERLRPWIAHVHCKDRGFDPSAPQGRFNKGMLPSPFGYGYIPSAEIIARLSAANYQGYYTFEFFGSPDYLEFARKSIAWMDNHAPSA